MPSTPVDSPYDLISDINSPDLQAPPYFLRHQQIKNVLSTAEVLEQQNQRLKGLNISTPDSSQTDHSSADDVSPKIQRRRKNLIAAAVDEDLAKKQHNLPKLSISLEHEPSQLLPSPVHNEIVNPMSKMTPDILNKRVLKSASAIDLSLKIKPNYNSSDRGVTDNVRRAKLKLETNFGEGIRTMKPHDMLEMDSIARSFNCGGGNGSSTASSREVSPSRDGPLINNLKPP